MLEIAPGTPSQRQAPDLHLLWVLGVPGPGQPWWEGLTAPHPKLAASDLALAQAMLPLLAVNGAFHLGCEVLAGRLVGWCLAAVWWH